MYIMAFFELCGKFHLITKCKFFNKNLRFYMFKCLVIRLLFICSRFTSIDEMAQVLCIIVVVLLTASGRCGSCNCSHQTILSSTTKTPDDPRNSTGEPLFANTTSVQNVLFPSTSDDELRRYNQLYFIVTGIFMPPVAIVGGVGNILTLVVLARGVLKSSSVVYLFVIAFLDLVYQIFSFPWKFTAYYSVTSTIAWKTFYSYYISYGFPVANISYTASVWMVVVFAIERFVMVVYPLKKHLVHESQAKRIVGAVSVFAVLINATRFVERVPYLTADSQTNQTYYAWKLTDLRRSLSYTSIMFWSSFVLNIALPFLLLGIFNTLIVYHIRRASQKALHLVSNVADQSNDARGSRDAQITRLLFGIVIAFFLCNTVGAVMSVLAGIYGMSIYAKIWFKMMVVIANAMLSINPTVNFVVYTTCSSAMRKSVGELLGCACLQEMEKNSASHETLKTSSGKPKSSHE